MHPAPATILAPSSSATAPAFSLERTVGEVVLLTSAAIAQALHERGNGGLSYRTRQQGNDLLGQLYVLRQACIDEGLDFDCIAREFGKRAIVRRWDQLRHAPGRPEVELTDAMLTEMISWPLAILAKIVRTRLH